MKKTYFLSGAAILLLLASSCEKENTGSLNPSQFQNPGSLSSSPIFNVTFGGTSSEVGSSATKSSDGGYMIAGGTASNDGDISRNHGSSDAWLVKIDRYGNKLWQKTYGGSESEHFHSIASTSDGGYIMAGETYSDDGDVSGYSGGGKPDVWVVKTDANGNIIWSKTMGDAAVSEIASSIIESSDGNYVVAGTRIFFTDYGYVIQLDQSGNILWEKALREEGSRRNDFTSVVEDPDGDYILTGFADEQFSADFWLVKLNRNGDVLMRRRYGGKGVDEAFSATIAQDGAYILAGQSSNDEGNTDVMVIKVNKEGTCLWERIFKAPDRESATSIIALDNGGYLIAKNTTTPAEGFTSSGSWLKLDSKGNKLDEQKVAAEKNRLLFLIKGADNNFITGGGNETSDMLVIGFQIP